MIKIQPSNLFIIILILAIIGLSNISSAQENKEKLDLNHAYELAKNGKVSEAIDIFEHHLALNPKDARIHLETAYLYLKLKRDPEALPHFEYYFQYYKEQPVPEVYLDMAYLCQREQHWSKSEKYFSLYLHAHPEHMDVKAELAYLLIKNNKKKEALQMMESILQAEPERETLRLNMAYLLLEIHSDAAYPQFKKLQHSTDPVIRNQANNELKNKPSMFGYFIYAALYHSFRFNINVMDINSRIYLKKSPIKPIEPYLFLTLSTDAESKLNPFPTIYSEQAAVVGAGLQWYFYKRSARIYIQYGYRQPFLSVPGIEKDHYSLSCGFDSFLSFPVGKKWQLELNNTLAYHSRFGNDYLFEGKEVMARVFNAGKYRFIKTYGGVLVRWDSKDYFYNNNYELVAGLGWSWRKDFTYQLFCEYRRGTYKEDTIYGRHYNEWIAGLIIGIYH